MQDFLTGGGIMGELIRQYDWTKTPMGPIEHWPRSLRTCVQIMLTSRQPIWIGWGKELIKLYNDPYLEIVGGKHPWALGKPASEVWKDIWKDIEPMLSKVMVDNEGTYVEEQLLIMERNGYPEETYYTFSYTPVAGDDGRTGGMICFNTDDTHRIITARQLLTLTNLGKALNDLRRFEHVFQRSIETITKNPQDFPFAILYVYKDNYFQVAEASVRGSMFEQQFPIINETSGELFDLFQEAMDDGSPKVMHDLKMKVGDMPKGGWSVAPDKALLLPIARQGGQDPYGFLVVGVNPFALFNENYVRFFQLVADQVAKSLSTIDAIDAERKRLEALAEIDRAKTVFFSNISHEFRTPLTLILGSLEDQILSFEDVTGERRMALETVHRNALRLLRLVNNLLDFSRIEAGRASASFQQADIASLTSALASGFSSLIESAGLEYELLIEHVNEPVYVDRSMWEKIVLNLISNAFKYTLTGKITVSLSSFDGHVHLKVSDTGIGIPKDELPHMFERFHRVQHAIARTFEGSGIGLSLVSELVKLHGGEVHVASEEGVGSEFTITIPVGHAHLDGSLIVGESEESISSLLDSFLEEAGALVKKPTHKSEAPTTGSQKPRVLIVDDNADMRDYIYNLLREYYHVTTAVNGEDGLQKIIEINPDLVVSDIMMPVMDGIRLMREIKARPASRQLPVILLSARAGEEAKLAGYETGADDYLVKPFSSKELMARIASHIKLARSRKEVESNLRNVLQQAPVAMCLLRGKELTIEIANSLALELWGRSAEAVMHLPVALALPEMVEQGFVDALNHVYSTGEQSVGNEVPVILHRFGKPTLRYLNFIQTPLRDDDNNIVGIITVGIDVSEQVYSRRKIEEARAALNNAIELAELGTWEIDLKTNFTTYSWRVATWWGLPSEGDSLDNVISCIHPDDREQVRQAVERAIHNKQDYKAEYRIVNLITSDERFMEANGNLTFDDQNNPVKLTGIVRDITLQKGVQQELERQVADRTAQLKTLNEDLKRSNDELMQFAYVASHDLQEPLRKIRTFSDILKTNLLSQNNDDDTIRYLQKIDSSAQRMSALIRDVLTYSQLDTPYHQREQVDLNIVLQGVMADFELLIEQKQASIHIDPLPVIPGDTLQFHQLFFNLVGNALKFSKEGGSNIFIRYRTEETEMETISGKTNTRRFHEFVIEDNGVGFDQSYSDQIFGLFTRLHNRQDYAGTGIGLAICKKIVERQKGHIRAKSKIGEGSTFTILIPAE